MLFDFLSLRFDPRAPVVEGAEIVTRHLSDLSELFADQISYSQMVEASNPVIYQVSTWEVASGDGDLVCGFGTLFPGKVGAEYYFTKGHYHAWRAAAEVYIGLSGSGYMLLEHEPTGESRLLPLLANYCVYVPGFTAHRTINVGNTPLTYIGIYSPRAGHDYGALAEANFRQVLVEQHDQPVLMDREVFCASLFPKDVS